MNSPWPFFVSCLASSIKPDTSQSTVAMLNIITIALHLCYVLTHTIQQSPMSTIINLAQNFVGSNNVDLLQPIGQFGTRLKWLSLNSWVQYFPCERQLCYTLGSIATFVECILLFCTQFAFHRLTSYVSLSGLCVRRQNQEDIEELFLILPLRNMASSYTSTSQQMIR